LPRAIASGSSGGQPVTIERGKLRFLLVMESKRRAPGQQSGSSKSWIPRSWTETGPGKWARRGCRSSDRARLDSIDLFEAAFDLSWTRDPFDRLIVAHAQMRGWRLATGDRMILANLPGNAVIALRNARKRRRASC
jgi:hypothetical protein